MADVNLKQLDGQTRGLSPEMVEGLRTAVRGQVALPGDAGYEEARGIWNAMNVRCPGLVVRCAGPNDVLQAVRLAKENRLLVSVRGGGHNIAGNAVCEGGLMIDLSPMTSVRVDPAARRAWVEPGVTLGDLDRETQVHGLATPTGINSTTGIAGLTLGGGFGWLSRKHGLTIDNLVSADVVTASGDLVRASGSENPDLFWAIRGGGGNFGVVTGFEFQLHPVGPQVLSGLIVHPFEDAPALLRQYRDLAANAPEEATLWAVLRKAPPLPFLPEDVHGKEICIFAVCYAGDMQAGEAALRPIRELGNPIADVVGPHAFCDWQAAFDPLLAPGARNYWKSHDFTSLDDAALDILVDYAGRLPSPECEIFIAQVGGAMTRVAENATAYPQRRSHFVMNVHTRWQEPGQDSECIAWAREFFERTAPYAAGTAYVNFMPEDETDRIAAVYGGNYERLATLKARFDPDNLFRMNQNIAPEPVAAAAVG